MQVWHVQTCGQRHTEIQGEKKNLSLEAATHQKDQATLPDTNSSRQAAIKEHAAHHATNPAGSEDQLSVCICAQDPFSVDDTKVDFCKWGPRRDVLW